MNSNSVLTEKILLYLMLVLGLILFSNMSLAADYGENITQPDWSEEHEAYLVSNLTELNWIRNAPKEDYRLIDDINATETENWNNGKGWKPVGEENYEFYGTLNGNGHTISNLTINRADEELVGFIAITGSDSVIKNLNIRGLSATGYNYIGGLVGENHGKISSVDYQGIVTLTDYINAAGGLIGYSDRGLHEDIEADIIINQTTDRKGTDSVGGIVGDLDGTLVNSSAQGSINLSKNEVGGLVGSLNGNIRRSYSSVDVQGDSEVGGLVGCNDYGTIKASCSNGKITGNEEIGGLVGVNGYDQGDGEILSSYTASELLLHFLFIG